MDSSPPSAENAAGYQDDILLAALAFIESAAHLPDEDRLECGFVVFGIPWSASLILGRRAPRLERRALRMASRDLVAAGMIKLRRDVSYSGRLTHFFPTAAGFRRAVELAAGDAALDLVADVLDSTDWGVDLAAIARHLTARSPADAT